MRIPGYKSVKYYISWLNKRFYKGAIILGYHRVASTEQDPYSICVSPEHFAEHLNIINQIMTPTSLSDLVSGLSTKTLPRRAIAITFDDGYVDNLLLAKPILETQGIPATIFIVSGQIGREFWWDQVARIIYSVSSLPEKIDIYVKGKRYSRNINHNRINGRRERLIVDLYRNIRPLPSEIKTEFIEQLSYCLGVTDKSNSELPIRPLVRHEIIELASSDLLEIGSHSFSHTPMTEIPVDSIKIEVQHSKSSLEKIIGKAVNKFSYPDGATSQAIQTEVASAGYTCACSSQYNIVSKYSNLFSLPRLWPLNRNGENFRQWLLSWIND